MSSADTAKYKTSILAFVNALLHGFDDVVERCRVREQLLTGQSQQILFVKCTEIDVDKTQCA